MISNTTRTRLIRVKRQISYYESKIASGTLDSNKSKLTADTVAALKWTLTNTYERIAQKEKTEIKAPVLDFLISRLRKIKYLRNKEAHDRVDAEITELHALDTGYTPKSSGMRVTEAKDGRL